MSKKLTPKQEKFAQNVAKGMKKKDAARDAGYSEKNAARAGTMLASDNNPIVKDRIHELQTKAADKAELTLGNHLVDLKRYVMGLCVMVRGLLRLLPKWQEVKQQDCM